MAIARALDLHDDPASLFDELEAIMSGWKID
jgi:hypothetical protein